MEAKIQEGFQGPADLCLPSPMTMGKLGKFALSVRTKAPVLRTAVVRHPQNRFSLSFPPQAGAGPPQLHVSPGGMSRLACVHLEGPSLQSFTQAHGLHTSNEL